VLEAMKGVLGVESTWRPTSAARLIPARWWRRSQRVSPPH